MRLGDTEKNVTIDESKIGRRKFNRRHWVKGQWFFGGEERGFNKCFIVPVEDGTREGLLPLIKKYSSWSYCSLRSFEEMLL